MSSVKQQSNPRVMQQKVEKAQRLLGEVKNSISLRKVEHRLWAGTLDHLSVALKESEAVLDYLTQISLYNKSVEEEKI